MIRIDDDLLSELTSLGQLHRNEAKIAAGITFAYVPYFWGRPQRVKRGQP